MAVDLVIAMPVSWLSVIADYNRFARTRAQSFTGTFSGYSIGNAWLYGLGVLLVLAGRVVDSSPAGIAAGVLGLSSGVVIGVLLLAGLVAGETPNAFADIYSAAAHNKCHERVRPPLRPGCVERCLCGRCRVGGRGPSR